MKGKSLPLTTRAFLLKPVLFFLGFLVVLTLIRVAYFLSFNAGAFTFEDLLPALTMGVRIDAKWLATLLVPAWLLWLVGARFAMIRPFALGFGLFGGGLMVLLGLINIEFYRFYGTPISVIIFGLFQDDTKAVVTQILKDYPVVQYLGLLAIGTLFPALLAKLIPSTGKVLSLRTGVLGAAVLSLLFAGALRGSLDTFPLRMQNLSVSTHLFINQCAQNGAVALYEAWKGQKGLNFKDGAEAVVIRLGFANVKAVDEALTALDAPERTVPAASAPKPHVVLAIMEAMGRDEFETHDPKTNDMLGALAGELKDALIFRNALTAASGTFPAVEAILFDSPYSPLSQSRYGRADFPFAKVLPFREAGYRVVFLTGGDANWRGINETLPLHGFDAVYGAADIRQTFPEANYGTWGVGDEWMFRYAERLLKEADETQKPLLLVMLSTTNHGPHHVPDGRPSAPVNPDALPAFVMRDKPREELAAMQETYQYAANWLGWFVGAVRQDGLLEKTVIATTGDHNARFSYPASGYWHHHLGVPFLFWVPQDIQAKFPRVDTALWATQRDLMPTLSALALGRAPLPEEGRNLLEPRRDYAYDFYGIAPGGFAIGAQGAVAIGEDGKLSCLYMRNDVLEPGACTPELEHMGRFSAAQRAKLDYVLRSSLLQ